MNSQVGRDYFDVLERKHEELFAAKQVRAAMQVARLLYAQTPHDSVQHGIAARGIAAGYNALGQHREAWQWAVEAWRIHNAQASSLQAVGECAVSGAYAGAMGMLVVVADGHAKCLKQAREPEAFVDHVRARARVCARAALADFEEYRNENNGTPHPQETLYISWISMTESITGDKQLGKQLAHQSFDLVEAAEGVWGGEQRDMYRERWGALGAIVIAETGELLEMGGNLYGTVREIV